MSDQIIKISLSEAEKILADAGKQGAHHHALFKGMREFNGRILKVTRACNTRFSASTQNTQPTLLLIGDDDETPTGPSGWNHGLITSALTHTHGICVHGCAANDLYNVLPFMTMVAEKMVLIESSPKHFLEWVYIVNKVAPKTPCVFMAPQGVEPPSQPLTQESHDDIL